jgi:ATP-binding protein involved in chromosome partitioning
MVDPRLSIIEDRIKEARSIIAVSSGKGGVGKSLIASTLALTLAGKGYKVGLFDLDFSSPSTHLILNIGKLQPKEDKGIIPPKIHNLEYMSIIYYSLNHAAPLRGDDMSNALIELLSITRWGKLDYLILDMPPGIGDVTLDLVRLIRRTKFLIVTTSSQLAFETVRKLVLLLREVRVPVIGVVENMKVDRLSPVREKVEKLGLAYTEEIPFDSELEKAIGDVEKLSATVFAKKVAEIAAWITSH